MAPLYLIPIAIRLASEYLPTLVTKIAGPKAANIAQEVVSTAAAIAGVPSSTKLEEIMSGLESNPMARDELRLQFEQLDLKYLEDMQDARRSQEVRGGQRGNYMLIGVTVGLVTCIATGLIISIKDKPIDPGVLALITTVAGALLKMFSDAFAFEFGSSRGSKEKDAQVTEFKNALLRIGESQGEAAKELVKSQQKMVEETVGRVMSGATEGVSPTGGKDDNRPRERDFVAQLIRGEI